MTLSDALARKGDERDSILDLYRKNHIGLEDLERQLRKIAAEEDGVRDRLTYLRTEEDTRKSMSSRLAGAGELLDTLRSRLKDDLTWEEKRELVELLVVDVTVDGEEKQQEKEPQVTVTYAFDGRAVTSTDTDSWRRPA